MSAYLATLQTNLQTAIAAAWPDVIAGGIWEVENMELATWDSMVPPYAFYWKDLTPTDFMAGAVTFIASTHIGWVGATGGGSATQLARGETLRDYLLTTGLTNFAVMDISGIAWDNTIEPNASFIKKGYVHRAVIVTASILVGDYFY